MTCHISKIQSGVMEKRPKLQFIKDGRGLSGDPLLVITQNKT